jgi:hypothetical protein
MIALRAGFDRFNHPVEGLGRRWDDVRRIEPARLGRAAAAENETYAEFFRHLENHMRGIETIAFSKKIVVIGSRRGSRQEQFDEPNARGRAQRFLVDLVPVGIGYRA